MVMNLVSAGSTPLGSMPAWLQWAVQVSPTTQFVAFVQAVLYQSAGLDAAGPRLAALAVLAAAFLLAVVAGVKCSLARAG